MKATYTTRNQQVTFHIEGDTPKAVWKELSAIQEVFDAEHTCGVCGSTELRFVMRVSTGDHEYYELHCLKLECRARFAFGQAKKGGGLFPKRKDEDGKFLPNRGWAKYSPGGHNEDENHEPAQAPETSDVRTILSRLSDSIGIKMTSVQEAREWLGAEICRMGGEMEYRHVVSNWEIQFPGPAKRMEVPAVRALLAELYKLYLGKQKK